MHWLTNISVWNRWITFFITAVLIGVSIFAAMQLKVEMIPDIEFPMTTVMTVYPGASPEEVMEEVTEPVEGAVSGIRGLRELSSTSVENMSIIFAEFDYGTDMDKVNAEISRRLDTLLLPASVPGQLSDGSENPRLFPLDMSMMPLVVMGLSGDMHPNELKALAIEEVVPRLEEVDGVFSPVSVEGGEEKVLISPDAGQLNLHQIPMAQLVAILSAQQYGSLEEIENTPISSAARVGDVAEVTVGPAPGTAITRTNGMNSVFISTMKQPEANTVSVANALEDEADRINQSLEGDAELIVVFDQSDYIERSISELAREAIIGGVLAVLVILAFLMTVRGSLVTAISIPLSILIGFLVMWGWGLTINILTLSAMAIAVGRIVDDSIVLLEVIFRRLHQGERFKDAAINGAREVAGPVTAATLATVAIFLPLAFVGGIVGEMFVPFALTVTFALLASLLVSLMVVPPLTSILVPKKFKIDTGRAWYQRGYTAALKWALGHRAYTLVIVAVLFVGSLGLVPVIGTSFMSSMGEKMIVVSIEMPLGTDMQTTSAKAAAVEDMIRDGGNPGVELYYTTVGSSSSFTGAFSAMMGGGGTNAATVEILLDSDVDLEQETEYLRDLLEPLGVGDTITVNPMESMFGELGANTFSVRLLGEDYQDVVAATEELAAGLETVEGLEDVESDIALVLPRPQVDIDNGKLAFHASQGLDAGFFNMELYGMMAGVDTGVIVDGRSLFVSGVMQSATSVDELRELGVSGGLTYPLKLGQIADVDIVDEATHIQRIDEHRSATVSAKVTEKDVGAVNRAAQEQVDSITTPGIEPKMGGVAEEMEETFRSMGIAIIIAIVIAFGIVVASFRSFISPAIIMVSLPLASIGALLGLLIIGQPIGASAMMGVLMLVGIVLTNAIVLIALVEQLRGKGMRTYDALVEAGRTRLRPILMTALTTMIALVPLAVGLGEGVLLASELAVVVIGGLFTSTLLTLVVIPVLYSLTDRFRRAAPVRAGAAVQQRDLSGTGEA